MPDSHRMGLRVKPKSKPGLLEVVRELGGGGGLFARRLQRIFKGTLAEESLEMLRDIAYRCHDHCTKRK